MQKCALAPSVLLVMNYELNPGQSPPKLGTLLTELPGTSQNRREKCHLYMQLGIPNIWDLEKFQTEQNS